MSYEVDLQKIADELEFDLEDVEMLFEVFLSSSKKAMSDLQNAILKNDIDGIFHAAHSLKGSAANLTLAEISELAKEIEAFAREKEDINYQEKFDNLKSVVDGIVTV